MFSLINKLLLIHLYLFNFTLTQILCENNQINIKQTKIWGPGLKPNKINLPARYFFIHPVDSNGKKFELNKSNNH